ncbi:MAG: mechanosensitive ion channel family protein [Clostridia bacterium]|nr:mechanosensitive ion channel family protein [Clostridia bacterium]
MNFETLLNTLLELFTTIGLKLLYGVALLFIGLKLIKWLKKKLPSFPFMERLDAGVRGFLISTTSIGLYVLLGVTIAMILGVPTASFIAALASGLAAIGLAMQGSLSNVAGGLMLLIFKPFRMGDYISCPDLSVEGTVKQITVVYTILHTYDGIGVTIPNGTLMNSVVKNLTITDARRLDLPFKISPAHPIAEVEAILADVVAAEPRVRPDPAPFTRLTEVAGDALTYTVRVWVPNGEYWPVRFDLTRAVTDALNARGIVLPREQLDVHLNQPGEHTNAN